MIAINVDRDLVAMLWNVVVAGTGGLSHQMNGERAGYNDTDWDAQFLELIHSDPKRLTSMRLADYARLGGTVFGLTRVAEES